MNGVRVKHLVWEDCRENPGVLFTATTAVGRYEVDLSEMPREAWAGLRWCAGEPVLWGSSPLRDAEAAKAAAQADYETRIRAALEPMDAPAVAGVEIPAGHTPGPWQVEEGTALVWGGGDADDQTSRGMGIPVAEAKGYEQRYWGRQIDWEERAANARLIALAPAMAEELVALRSQNDALMRERTSMIATHRENRALAEKRHAAELAALRARVAELEAGQDWQPIETAPKDGTEVIIFNPRWSYAPKAKWDLIDGDEGCFGAWVLEDDFWSPGVDNGALGWAEDIEDGNMPTVWCPLPTPPASQEGQADG